MFSVELTNLGFHRITCGSPISLASLLNLSLWMMSCGCLTFSLSTFVNAGCLKGTRPYLSRFCAAGSDSTGVTRMLRVASSASIWRPKVAKSALLDERK